LYPSAYLKDFFSASLLILSYSFYLSLNFNFLEEFLNNCLVTIEKTPFEMSPEWYFLPSFSVLKYFESKTLGIVFSVFILFLVFSSLFVGNYRRYGY
jgi:quinol-cytochrome oxidoreductase complex cytochrome b subunit